MSVMQILPDFKKWGATGLLVEYEDVFPYREKYEVLRAKNSYRYIVCINVMLCLSAYCVNEFMYHKFVSSVSMMIQDTCNYM